MVLDINSGKHGNNLIIWPRNGGDNQLWTWEGNLLVSKTEYVAYVYQGNRAPGTNVISWNKLGGANQKWRQDGDQIVSSLHGLVLDIKGGSKEQGTEIILWNATGGDNQKWVFKNGCV